MAGPGDEREARAASRPRCGRVQIPLTRYRRPFEAALALCCCWSCRFDVTFARTGGGVVGTRLNAPPVRVAVDGAGGTVVLRATAPWSTGSELAGIRLLPTWCVTASTGAFDCRAPALPADPPE